METLETVVQMDSLELLDSQELLVSLEDLVLMEIQEDPGHLEPQGQLVCV